MDTLSNVASAASKVVFGDGENNKEPVSGAQGDVSKGEPYDAGNMDEAEQTKLASEAKANEIDDSNTKSAEENKGEGVQGEGEVVEEPEGPGPRSLEEIAKGHDGDAGNVLKESTPKDNVENGENQDGDHGESESKGTGEQYVKTSGLAADGGDFDATKPGAGKEADRLMEEKGMHHDDGKQKSQDGLPSKKDKPSLGERIKAKFRKN